MPCAMHHNIIVWRRWGRWFATIARNATLYSVSFMLMMVVWCEPWSQSIGGAIAAWTQRAARADSHAMCLLMM